MEETTTAIEVLDTFNITEDVKKDITASFEPYLDGLKDLLDRGGDIKIESEDQKDDMAEARSIRLNIQKRRTGMDKAKKKDKEQYMIPANAYDAVFRFIKGEIEPVEKHLKEQEKFAERLEEKRLDELVEERMKTLAEYEGEFIIEGYNLREMHEETFSQLIGGFAAQRKERLRLEEEQEEARIAQDKKDAEEKKEKDAEIAQLKKEKDERDEKEAEEKLIREAEQAEKDAELQELKEKNAVLQAEKDAEEKKELEEKEKEGKEEKRKQEEAEEAERQAALSPDKEKMEELANEIGCISFPELKSIKARSVADGVKELLVGVVENLRIGIGNL